MFYLIILFFIMHKQFNQSIKKYTSNKKSLKKYLSNNCEHTLLKN